MKQLAPTHGLDETPNDLCLRLFVHASFDRVIGKVSPPYPEARRSWPHNTATRAMSVWVVWCAGARAL
jgi:hypothetical protein